MRKLCRSQIYISFFLDKRDFLAGAYIRSGHYSWQCPFSKKVEKLDYTFQRETIFFQADQMLFLELCLCSRLGNVNNVSVVFSYFLSES